MENQVLGNIRKRRSIRAYKPEQLADDELSQIIEAGRFAPSGGNNQTSHFVVVQNAQTLNKLKRLVVAEFAKMEVAEDTYKSLKTSILRSKKGDYDFIFGAPTLIIASNRRGYGNAMADCAVALENMMLAATSLQIGSCWINQLRWLADNEHVKEYLTKLEISEDEIVCGALALGYPDQQMPSEPLPRKGNRVTYIR